MLKLIPLTAVLATLAMPALASQQARIADQDRPAHAREARGERHGCSRQPAGEWMPITEVTAKLQEQGWTILKFEAETGCFEARVIDDKGAVLELKLNAVTAEIVRRRERK